MSHWNDKIMGHNFLFFLLIQFQSIFSSFFSVLKNAWKICNQLKTSISTKMAIADGYFKSIGLTWWGWTVTQFVLSVVNVQKSSMSCIRRKYMRAEQKNNFLKMCNNIIIRFDSVSQFITDFLRLSASKKPVQQVLTIIRPLIDA